VTGGFVHLYTALEAGLFAKYGLDVQHTFIRGSGTSLAALSANEVQFVYCAVEATIPGLASGSEGRVVAAPLLGLPYVLISRPDVRSVPDLRGKSASVARPGQLTDRLIRLILQRHNLRPNEDVEIRPVGGSQPEGYQSVISNVAQAAAVTPPLDAQARRDGLNVIYHMEDLGLPFVYSALHSNVETIRNQPRAVQRFVAALAEAVYYTEKQPEVTRQVLRKVLELEESDALDAAYEAYARKHVNRRLTIPIDALDEGIEHAREQGTQVTVRGGADVATNQFVDDLERTGFLQALWGAELPPK
jgi:NitT/TauT family transport system substrate-binding protein